MTDFDKIKKDMDEMEKELHEVVENEKRDSMDDLIDCEKVENEKRINNLKEQLKNPKLSKEKRNRIEQAIGVEELNNSYNVWTGIVCPVCHKKTYFKQWKQGISFSIIATHSLFECVDCGTYFEGEGNSLVELKRGKKYKWF